MMAREHRTVFVQFWKGTHYILFTLQLVDMVYDFQKIFWPEQSQQTKHSLWRECAPANNSETPYIWICNTVVQRVYTPGSCSKSFEHSRSWEVFSIAFEHSIIQSSSLSVLKDFWFKVCCSVLDVLSFLIHDYDVHSEFILRFDEPA